MSTSYVNTQFKINLLIDGDDKLSSGIDRIEIMNSIETGWPIIYITTSIDNQMIIEKNIYGQSELELEIIPLQEDGIERKPFTRFKLLYLQSNLELTEKKNDNVGREKRDTQRRRVVFQCFALNAYNVWTTFVNKLYQEPAAIKPFEVVEEILMDKGFSRFMSQVSSDNINDAEIGQLIIPPMTLKRMVEYIDDRYSIYEGPLLRYCNYSGHIVIRDLWKHYDKNKDNPILHVYKLPSYYNDNPKRFDEINRLISEKPDIRTSTFLGFSTVHNPNSSLIHSGYTNTFITHPRENLFHLTKVTAEDIIPDMSYWHDSDQAKYHEFLKNRKLYYIDHSGFEESGYSGDMIEHFANARMSINLMNCFTIKFQINRNINIDNVMKVGDVVYIDAESEHEILPDTNYSGAYIMNNSVITFYRDNDGVSASWDCSADIMISRTVQHK